MTSKHINHFAVYDDASICFIHVDEIELTACSEQLAGRYILNGLIQGQVLISSLYCTRIQNLSTKEDLVLEDHVVQRLTRDEYGNIRVK